MADQQQAHAPGGYWSNQNKIPTVGKFLQNLDKDKKERDRLLDEETKANQQAKGGLGGGNVQAHQNEVKQKHPEGQKTVTDPVTGNQVVIEDVNKAFVDRAKNPQLSIPNANLGKDTTVKTEASMSNPEYREKQDITAPPDPIAEGKHV